MPESHCLDYYRFAVKFLIAKCESSNFVLLFQNYLVILVCPQTFYVKFNTVFQNSEIPFSFLLLSLLVSIASFLCPLTFDFSYFILFVRDPKVSHFPNVSTQSHLLPTESRSPQITPVNPLPEPPPLCGPSLWNMDWLCDSPWPVECGVGDVLGSPSYGIKKVCISVLPMPGAQVRSLVREQDPTCHSWVFA